MSRRRFKSRGKKPSFTKTAMKSHGKNRRSKPMRGGYRL